MQLHQIKPVHEPKHRKRVGRGGKRGTYSGKGVKGQRSRAGAKVQPAIRQWIKRYPKLRGYRFGRVSEKILSINLGILNKHFEPGDLITPSILVQRGLLPRVSGRIPKVKILAGGEIKKKFSVRNCRFSYKAAQKLRKAGGATDFKGS